MEQKKTGYQDSDSQVYVGLFIPKALQNGSVKAVDDCNMNCISAQFIDFEWSLYRKLIHNVVVVRWFEKQG